MSGNREPSKAKGEVAKAISELDGRDFGGRSLRVNAAQEKRRSPGGGGDRY